MVTSQSWAQNQIQKRLVVETIDGQNFDLSKQKNKIVLVVFWASWCDVCVNEISQLEDLYKKYHDSGLEIIGLSIDGKTEKAKNLSYKIAILDEAKINDFENPKTMPVIYVIDKNGLVHDKLYLPQQIKIENVEKIIGSLLTKSP
ncbi:MAG: putative thioredoxin related protein [Rickettsiaceae bacterium]|nr:putative thioredoxin related protein [Rickettsiaceae bacterium]